MLAGFNFLEVDYLGQLTLIASRLFSSVEARESAQLFLEFGLHQCPGVHPAEVRLRTHGTCFASKISLWKDSQMLSTLKSWKPLSVFALSLFLLPAVMQAQHYKQTNLVSDITGMSQVIDPNLKNPWGLTRSPGGSPWWIGNINSVLEVDNSEKGGSNGAVYKGATSGEINGHRFLYVTNFRKARIEVYDTNFKPVSLGEEALEAEGIPRGFAPFNIQNIGGTLFVTYAKQDAARHDDVAGDGLGFVEIFTPAGKHIGHLQHGPWFNSPWGVVWTTRDFGEFSNAILVGNFGSGRIAAFNGFTYKFMGFVKNPDDSILTIDGLWSLTFGNDVNAGPANTLFFTAGINGEQDGLFGTITPVDGLDGDEE